MIHITKMGSCNRWKDLGGTVSRGDGRLQAKECWKNQRQKQRMSQPLPLEQQYVHFEINTCYE